MKSQPDLGVSCSHSDLCDPAASGPARAAPRGPAEAAGPEAEAAGRAGGAGAQDERAADGQRGQAAGAGEHEEGEEKTHKLMWSDIESQLLLYIFGPEKKNQNDPSEVNNTTQSSVHLWYAEVGFTLHM